MDNNVTNITVLLELFSASVIAAFVTGIIHWLLQPKITGV